MRILTVAVLVLLFTGCKTTSLSKLIEPPKKPTLNIERIKDKNFIINKITTSNTLDANDLYVVASCQSNKNIKFSHATLIRTVLDSDIPASPSKWFFKYSNKYDYVNKIYNFERFKEKRYYKSGANSLSRVEFEQALDSLSVVLKGRYLRLGNISNEIYRPQELGLPKLINDCVDLANSNELKIENDSKKAWKERKLLIKNTSQAIGHQPMYTGANSGSFLHLGYDLMKHGRKNFTNKFVWINDSYYRVKKVSIGKRDNLNLTLLTVDNYRVKNAIPAIVMSGKSPIVGQYWGHISKNPLVFIDIISGDKVRRKFGGAFFEEQYMVFADLYK